MTTDIVFKLNIDSAEDQQKALELVVSKVQGVEFIAFDMEEKNVDSMVVNDMLQKSWSREICSLPTYDSHFNLIKHEFLKQQKIADAAVEFLLQNVKELLVYNVELLGDAKQEVEDLRDDLEVFQGFLEDSADYHGGSNHNEQQAIVRKIRSIANRAEDAIDNFVVEKSRNSDRNAFIRAAHVVDHLTSVRGIAGEVRSIRSSVDKINAQKGSFARFLDRDLRGKGGVENQPPVVEEDNVDGFDEEAEKVISLLREDSEELEVIGIVGMAGIGKTTLANKIYKNDIVDYEFIHRAWAFVSKDSRIEDVFISILKQLTDTTEAIYKESSTELAKKVRECLMQKKYLIVLDDVWTHDTLDMLRIAFPNNKKHSRILLTTRKRFVAEYANVNRPPHELKLLTKGESWELLEKKVFGKTKCPQDLTYLGETIAEKCGGLPLAIVVIAGTLLPKRNIKDWWDLVAQGLDDFIVKDERKFLEVVGRSYNSLPPNLKWCFLYFGLIPRGPIPVWKLIRLWLAEGFIKYDSRSGVENAAAVLLDELVDRNLVMATSWKSNGRVKSCRVHDTLRIFCKEEAETQNLYHEIDMFNCGSLGNYRRICVSSNAVQYISSKSSGEQVRTFLTFNPDPTEKITLEPTDLKKMLKGFKRLRVLEASSIKFTRFPKELRQLVLLRYLAFSCNFQSIPASISSLWNLQTLIILTSNSTLEVHEDIWKLFQLRHLQTNSSTKLPSPPASNKDKGRENMQTLSTISPESCTEAVFSRTPNIKKLGVRGKVGILLENGSKFMENLVKLENLVNLKIINDFTSHSAIPRLSRKFPKNLRKLTLSGTSLSWDDMSILGDLVFLEVLKLKDNAFSGDVWKPKSASFGCLRVLFIDRTNLVKWEANDKQYSSLIRLVLRNCNDLTGIPSCLAGTTSFQNLEICCCSTSVIASARELHMKTAKQGQVNKSSKSLKLTVYPPDM